MKLRSILLLAAFPLTFACCSDDNDDDMDNFVNQQDKDFTLKASMGNTAEIAAGQMASTKAMDTAIQSFGKMMVMHHQMAQDQLQQMAGSLNLYAPDSVDAAHAALAAQLQTLSGRAFDSVYINSQVKDHQATIQLFDMQKNDGNNGQLVNYASSLLPQLHMHLDKANTIVVKYK